MMLFNSEFEKTLWFSSVHLSCHDENMLPIEGNASGCMIDYCGHRFLLTVFHVTKNQKNWALCMRAEVNKHRVQIYQLGEMNFLIKGDIQTREVKQIDFSYVEIPKEVVAYRQEIEIQFSQPIITSEQPITIHKTRLKDVPDCSEEYGFCGIVKPTFETHREQKYMGGEIAIYVGLKYLRMEDDYYVFSLPFDHPGHEYFEGCSGAPIINKEGAVVALVCSGIMETNEIYGISLNQYKTPIDVLIGNVN